MTNQDLQEPLDADDALPFPSRHLIRHEMAPLIKLSLPVIGFYLLQAAPGFVNVIFMGQLGTEELAGAALGFMFCNVTGFSILWGLATALDTLCTQAYGAKAYHRVGILAQRGFLIMLLFCFPIAAVWLSSSALFKAILINQSPRVATLAGTYVSILATCLPAINAFAVVQKYLQAQGILMPQLIVGFFANSVNILMNYLLINVVGLGFIGAPISVSITYYLLAILTIAYTAITGKHKKTWPEGFSRSALQEWRQYLNLAIPGCLMISLEWWAYEIATLIAGSIGEIELASYSIILQLWSITFMVPLGMSVAISIRVGNHLGAGKPTMAKAATLASYVITSVWVVTAAVVIIVTRDLLPKIFTSDVRVSGIVSGAMWYVAASQVLDSLQALSSGVLRGLGRQKIGAAINFVGFYVFGLPASLLLVIYGGISVIGCIVGLMIGLIVQVSILAVVLLRQDFDKMSKVARDRAIKAFPLSDIDKQ